MASRTFEATFATPLGSAHAVLEFRHEQRLNKPAEASVDAQLVDYQDPDEIIGKGAVLTYAFEDSEPFVFHGIIESVTVIGSAEGASSTLLYRFHIVANVALLDRAISCTIFQDLDTKEIVTKVLEREGIATDLQQWKLSGSYVKREYCVQYNESALAFISRLCEDEGIWFHTEPSPEGDKNVIVFADDSSAAPPIDGAPDIPFRARGGFVQLADAITDVRHQRRVVPGKSVLRDYNFKKPTVDLTSEAVADAHDDLELYDYPGGYFEPAEGRRRAKVRLEAEQAQRRTMIIEADCTRIQVGRQLEITESADIGADGKYFITGVRHTFVHASRVPGAGGGGEGGGFYKCEATLLDSTVQYRPPAVTPRPIIDGPQTATIVAPAGSPEQEIHTDEHGRAKVLFNWDLAGVTDDKASCWMRVGQVQTSGSMYLPRLNWEAVVQYLEGDPDRPVITGKLYNGAQMPPYALPEGKTRTSIQSLSTPGGGGFNEIRMEDKAGGEEIMINAQFNKNIVTANNKKKVVHANETQSVGVNAETKVGANQTVKVTKGVVKDVTADQSTTVGGNRKLEVNAVSSLSVGGSSTTTVGGNHMEMDGNPLEGLIAVAAEKALEAAVGAASKAAAKLAGGALAKVNQAMGPVNAVLDRAQKMGSAVEALANGNLGAAAGALAAAAGVPGADQVAGGMAGDGAAGGHAAPAGGPAPGPGGAPGAAGPDGKPAPAAAPAGVAGAGIALANKAITSALAPLASKGVRKVAKALEGGSGGGGGAGGGASEANAAGPDGKVDGIDKEDREKGPGHNTHKVDGSMTETVGALKLVASVNGINTNVKGAFTQTVSAAKVEMVMQDLSEAVAATKTENEIGLIVVTKADETENAAAMKSEMVGGAIAEKIGGNHTIVAGAMASFIGALHKIDAKTKITFKCGGSSVVIDGSGVTITSAMVTITAGKIQLPKATTEL
jgi:type VI secretion system secreted protein VgrG